MRKNEFQRTTSTMCRSCAVWCLTLSKCDGRARRTRNSSSPSTGTSLFFLQNFWQWVACLQRHDAGLREVSEVRQGEHATGLLPRPATRHQTVRSHFCFQQHCKDFYSNPEKLEIKNAIPWYKITKKWSWSFEVSNFDNIIQHCLWKEIPFCHYLKFSYFYLGGSPECVCDPRAVDGLKQVLLRAVQLEARRPQRAARDCLPLPPHHPTQTIRLRLQHHAENQTQWQV